MPNLQDYKFNIGDEVITTDGMRGTITDICECDRCKDRGFCEPVWVDECGNENFITDYSIAAGAPGYYKIGAYRFREFDKESVLMDIEFYEAELARHKKHLQFIEEYESKEET